jgi:hypothetical protein
MTVFFAAATVFVAVVWLSIGSVGGVIATGLLDLVFSAWGLPEVFTDRAAFGLDSWVPGVTLGVSLVVLHLVRGGDVLFSLEDVLELWAGAFERA